MMIMCELIKGALALEERRRQHGVWEKVSKSMDVMIEFARDIQTFMVASLPEMEELMQEYDENEYVLLITIREILVGSIMRWQLNLFSLL